MRCCRRRPCPRWQPTAAAAAEWPPSSASSQVRPGWQGRRSAEELRRLLWLAARSAQLAVGLTLHPRCPPVPHPPADLEARGGGTPVPEFPPGLDWLNTPPLRLGRELRGKVVVLDFWTYCCINCMHVLPDLAYVERRYEGRPFAVVGVHSAKFDNEKDSEAIRSAGGWAEGRGLGDMCVSCCCGRQPRTPRGRPAPLATRRRALRPSCPAVLRYDISHPVVNDSGMALWRALGVSSWPTLTVVSPAGRVIATVAGEGHRQDIDDIVAAALEVRGVDVWVGGCGSRAAGGPCAAAGCLPPLVSPLPPTRQYYGEAGQLDPTPLPVALEKDKDPRLAASPLRFPGARGRSGAGCWAAGSSTARRLARLAGRCGAPRRRTHKAITMPVRCRQAGRRPGRQPPLHLRFLQQPHCGDRPQGPLPRAGAAQGQGTRHACCGCHSAAPAQHACCGRATALLQRDLQRCADPTPCPPPPGARCFPPRRLAAARRGWWTAATRRRRSTAPRAWPTAPRWGGGGPRARQGCLVVRLPACVPAGLLPTSRPCLLPRVPPPPTPRLCLPRSATASTWRTPRRMLCGR